MIDNFTLSLGQELSRMSDGSLKVGIQGYDSNRWRIEEILPALSAYNNFAKTVLLETGYNVPPTDVWGGGQVSQAPRFLGEDPFVNLSKMREVAPDLHFKCIYRGRQGFGFLPCPDEIQELAITEASLRGMQVYRTFDPMNDASNMTAGLNAILRHRRKQEQEGISSQDLVSAEALIFYVLPPETKTLKPVWGEREMLEYALELAKMGFHEISIADYAEQLPDYETTYKIIAQHKEILRTNGFDHVKVNLFAQGGRIAIFDAALDAGADTVDVAIGDLSDGLSNPNIRALLEHRMKKRGFDITKNKHKHHPILESLGILEEIIEHSSRRHIPYRMSNDLFTPEELSRTRLAYNAVSALFSAINKEWDTVIRPNLPAEYLSKYGNSAKDQYLKDVLDTGISLWEQSGQFNPVTPFGFIGSFQSEELTRERICGRELPLGRYRKEYQDMMKGRYGRNLGIETGDGDVDLANAFHIYEVLEIIQKNLSDLDKNAVELFFERAGLNGLIGLPWKKENNEISLYQIKFSDKIEGLLRSLDFPTFKAVVEETNFGNSDLDNQIKFAVTRNKFEQPQITLEDGRQAILSAGFKAPNMNNHANTGGLLSDFDRYALISVMFRINSDTDPFVIGRNLFRYVNDEKREIIGDIERDIRPFDVLPIDELDQLSMLEAKKEILDRIKDDIRLADKTNNLEQSQHVLERTANAIMLAFTEKLRKLGYSEDQGYPYSLEFALSASAMVIDEKKSENMKELAAIPPLLWERTNEL